MTLTAVKSFDSSWYNVRGRILVLNSIFLHSPNTSERRVLCADSHGQYDLIGYYNIKYRVCWNWIKTRLKQDCIELKKWTESGLNWTKIGHNIGNNWTKTEPESRIKSGPNLKLNLTEFWGNDWT